MRRDHKKTVNVLLTTATIGLSGLPPQMTFADTGTAAEKKAFERQNLEFSDKWMYIKGDIQDARYLEYDDSNGEEVTLPHARDHYELYDLDLEDIQSVDWYRRHFTIPVGYTGKRVFVEFEGGGQKNAVYVNGGLVGQATGMFTHFKFDITDYISFGDFDNVIAVSVDSKFYENELPPGIEYDFYMAGGLHGDAFMTVTDPVYVDSAFYRNETACNGDSNAVLHGNVTVKNTGKQAETIKVETVLVDGDGLEVILASQTVTVDSEKSEEVDLTGAVENPRLWSLADPYLYMVKTNLYAGNTIKVDNYEHSMGIRTFSVTPASATEAHAYLNGEEIELLGINKHMQAPYLMNSMPNRLHEEDAYTLKYDLGMNLIRTSHYQQDPAFLDACDKIGLLVEEEALGWGDTPGWGQFEDSVLKMVKRDRNHPSIVVWSVIPNERRGDVPEAGCQALAKKVKELDPSRLTIQEEDQDNPLICDIYGYHDYNMSGQLKVPPKGVNTWMVTEWNTNLGKYFVIPDDSETRKLNSLVEESTKLSVFQSDPRVLGSLRWDAFGYLTSFKIGEKGKNINKYRCSGLYSLWKAPIAKTWLGYSFQAQGDPEVVGDVLKIGSEWKEDSPKEIWVVSNLDRVGLFYQRGMEPEVQVDIVPNSSSLPTAAGGVTDYKGLVKFTLPEGCGWTPDSRLIARGYRTGGDTAIKEQEVYASTYEVEKEGAKVVLHNVTSETGAGDTIRADGADMAYLVAEIQDKNGQREYYGDENISARQVSGPGSLWYGKQGMAMTDGISGFYVKSQHGMPGDIEVVVSVDIGDHYDDSWEQIVYDSNWQSTESQEAYHKKIHRSAAPGASVTIPFTGTQIALYGQNETTNGTAAITIDGKRVGKADFSCLQKYGLIANQEVFRSSVLDPGEHTLVMTADSAMPVNLDRIKVYDGIADITSEPLTVTSESCSIEMVACDPSLPKAEDKSLLTPSKETLSEIELMGERRSLPVKEQLKELAAQAEAVKQEDFVTASVITMEKALEYAYNVLGISGFSDQDGLKALKQLTKALEALKVKANTAIEHTVREDSEDILDTALDDLREKTAEVEAMKREGYTLASLEAADRIWLEAVSLLGDSNRILEKMKDCTKRLSDSIQSLEATTGQGKADTQNLSDLLTELLELKPDGYSESSWREFLYDIQSAVRTYGLVLTGRYPQITVKASPGITSVLINAAADELLNAKRRLKEIWVWDPSAIPPIVIVGASQYTIGGSVKTEAYNQAVIALQQLGDFPGQQETEAALSVLEAAAITADTAAIQDLMSESDTMNRNSEQYTPEVCQKFRAAYDSLTAVLAALESPEIAKINGAALLKVSVDELKSLRIS